MPHQTFSPLPTPLNASGQLRRVGVEVELGGIDASEVAKLCAGTLGGRAEQQDTHEWQADGSALGKLEVYLDTALRKTQAGALRDAGLELGREVVPVEIVTQPVTLDRLAELDRLRRALRDAGALGSTSGLFFGFGVHLNMEVADRTVPAMLRPLLAYALIEDWMREAQPIDPARRLLPFTDPYPTRFVEGLIDLGLDAGLEDLIRLYLGETPTRNRGLDMLPLLADLWPEMVEAGLDEGTKLSPRPAFHFRLPDCRIDEADWSLLEEWNRWLLVELVADDTELMQELAAHWRAAHQGMTLFRSDRAHRAGRILRASDLEAAS